MAARTEAHELRGIGEVGRPFVILVLEARDVHQHGLRWRLARKLRNELPLSRVLRRGGSSEGTRLHLPDVSCVLRDRPIAREPAGGRQIQDGLARPRIRIRVDRAELAIRIEIRAEVGKVHVVITAEQRLVERRKDAALVAAEMVGENEVQRGAHLRLVVVVAPSRVPSVSAPFIMNFILLVPLASYPAVEIWFERSLAGMTS